MKKIITFLFLLLFALLNDNLFAQFEGYISESYGYNSNPLYTYLKQGDQLKETYLELKYSKEKTSSLINFSYIGDLSIFNTLADRNYYQHTLAGGYKIKLLKNEPGKNQIADADSSGEEDEEDFSNQVYDAVTLGAAVNARHDRREHYEYDNYGLILSASYQYLTGKSVNFNLKDEASFRNYPSLLELSNINNSISGQLIFKNNNFKYGIAASLGMLYYTQTAYDTSKYEQVINYNSKSHGKGKAGANLTSNKKILLTPQNNGTYQLIPAFFAENGWETGLWNLTLSYRYNLRSAVRYLAQYAGANALSQDLYSESFSFEGPEAKFKFNQTLPLNIRFSFEGLFQYQTYKAPALNLNAEQIADNRKDIRSSADVSIARYFALSDDFGFDITLSGGMLRNQSNDDYNDYSTYYASFALGISF